MLAVLILAGVAWGAWQIRARRTLRELLEAAPMWLIAAAVITVVLPNVEQRLPDGTPIGLPIRGYGVMVLLGLLAGIGITVHRGNRLGVASELIVGLGFWMMLGGVAGARLFYVVQKWDEFSGYPWVQRLVAIVKLTEGGLVIYGGVIGGLVAGGIYCYRHRLNVAATADLIAPGFLLGLALGRIGCLLHGCCFGGVCQANLPTIQFPHGSGPYQAQAASGQLLGLELDPARLPATVRAVREQSPAAKAGIQAGMRVTAIYLQNAPFDPSRSPTQPAELVVDVELADGDLRRHRVLMPTDLPQRSLPVHPSQIYAAINAALLCWLVWLLQPLPKHDGVAFLSGVVLYAVTRFLLEGVRSDEGGQLGTSLTIAQLVSIGSGSLAIVGILAIIRTPGRRVWDWSRV